jgi:hypothetical protein
MRTAAMTLMLGGAALALAACQNKQNEQNIAIDNGIPANADIEALPPDESSATPSNELVNGADNADVGELNASSNSY